MRVLNPRLQLDVFFARLRRAPQRVLLVDYDGTLAPFHPSPARATPYPRVARLLNEIVTRRASRVVMVSGRSLADMETPLAHVRASEVWAAHGWQHGVPGGASVEYAPRAGERAALDAAASAARSLEALGARLERKPASLAVHWRGLEAIDAAAVRAEARARWCAFETQGLELLEFDGGVELRSLARTKASAVQEALAGSPAGTVCAYLGDDRTDEDAFRAIGTRGIAVLVRPQLRSTAADLWLEPPSDLVVFLERWRACAGLH